MSGPVLGMFEVFSLIGPPTLGGCHFGPDSTWAWIGFHFATHCNADQRTRNAATACILRTYNAAKCNCRSAPPDSLADFKGAASQWGGVGKGGKGKGKGGEVRGRREGERSGAAEVDSDVQLEQGRRLAKAGPNLCLRPFSLKISFELFRKRIFIQSVLLTHLF